MAPGPSAMVGDLVCPTNIPLPSFSSLDCLVRGLPKELLFECWWGSGFKQFGWSVEDTDFQERACCPCVARAFCLSCHLLEGGPRLLSTPSYRVMSFLGQPGSADGRKWGAKIWPFQPDAGPQLTDCARARAVGQVL